MAFAYYNEFDEKPAAWLRELIASGHLPDGEVDTRSITEVDVVDLVGFDQHHFFAGIGGWPLSLRLAGWPDDRPVWTASMPCQPFSAAGKQKGYEDERHLAPVFLDLLARYRPAVVFGEQVASPLGRAWLADLFLQMEALGYEGAGADLCAAGVGAPHIRQRLYWVGHAVGEGLEGHAWHVDGGDQSRWIAAGASGSAAASGAAGGLGHPNGADGERRAGGLPGEEASQHGAREPEHGRDPDRPEHAGQGRGGLADGDGRGLQRGGQHGQQPEDGGAADRDLRPDAVDSFWGAADWLFCRDARWRPVEPGTFPLANGVPNRVGLLRGYGNAIVPQVAAAFIEAAIEAVNQEKHK